MKSSNAEVALTLGCLAALREEINVAMGCISRNALREFELSLWRQEMLCAKIRRASGTVFECTDREMRRGIRQMCIGLKDQSQSYAKLIQQCNRSNMILLDLCSLYAHSREHAKNAHVPSLCCEA